MLGVQAVLDNRGTSEQSLLQAAQRLILDLDRSLFFKRPTVIVAALLEDGHEDVLLLLLLLVVLIIFLAHAHFIARLCIDGFLEDALEDLIHVLSAPLLVDSLLALISRSYLTLHLLLLRVDLLMAVHLELMVLLLDLLLLGLLLAIFVIDVVDVGVSNEVVTVPLFITSCNFTLLVVVVDVDRLHEDVELSLLDLVSSGKVLIQLELLGHLIDDEVLVRIVVRLDLQ